MVVFFKDDGIEVVWFGGGHLAINYQLAPDQLDDSCPSGMVLADASKLAHFKLDLLGDLN